MIYYFQLLKKLYLENHQRILDCIRSHNHTSIADHILHTTEEEIHLEAHLECTSDISLTEFNTLLHQIEVLVFDKFGINHITIQPEFKKEDPKDFIVQD